MASLVYGIAEIKHKIASEVPVANDGIVAEYHGPSISNPYQYKFNRRVVDATAGGVDTASLTDHVTLAVLTSARVQRLNPGAGHRNVTLPAVAYTGLDYVIVNTGSGNNLVVKNAGGDTIVTVGRDQTGFVWSDGAAWYGVTTISAAASGGSLDAAFDVGGTIDGADATSPVTIGDGTAALSIYGTAGSNLVGLKATASEAIHLIPDNGSGTGDVVVNGDCDVVRDASVGRDLAVTRNLSVTGTLSVTGAQYLAAIVAAAAGNTDLTLDAAGTGKIILGQTSTGKIEFYRTTQLQGAQKVEFRDVGQYIYSSGASTLDVVSAGGVNVTAAGASAWAFSGGALTIGTTSQNLTISTGTSGTLALTSAGALNLTGAGASTWAVSGGALVVQTTSQNLTVRTVTSGTLAVTSAGAVAISAASASTLTVTSANLTISTATSGTLAVNSAGALNFAAASASAWTVTGANLTISTASSGTLAVTSAGALNLTGAANSVWTVNSANLTISTGTSGTLAVTSAGALNLTATNGASTWQCSGGALLIKTTSQNLTIQTDTGGNLALTSAGTFGVTGVGNSSIAITSGNLALSTVTSGTLSLNSAAAFTVDGTAASTITVTGAHLTISTATSGNLALTSAGTFTLTAPASTSISCASHLDASSKGAATKVKAGSVGDSDFDVDVDGNFAVDSTNGRWYFRYGAAWHYCAITAGVQVPAHEVKCPKCGKAMEVGQRLVVRVDKALDDGALHAIWEHETC